MTQIEKIRKMSAEELAELLECDFSDVGCKPEYCECYSNDEDVPCKSTSIVTDCRKATVKWLESEIK